MGSFFPRKILFFSGALGLGLTCLGLKLALTDSYVGDNGKTHYVVPSKGLWTSEDSKKLDYKLLLEDFVHGLFALTVFGVLMLLDHKTVGCFYPMSATLENTLLKVLPPTVGVVAGVLFMFFPTNRHGIGYSSRVSKSGGGEVSLPKA